MRAVLRGNHNPLRHTVAWDAYDFVCKFDTNSTSAPDGVDPAANSEDLAVARTGVGTFTITFGEHLRPYELLWGDACIIGDEPTLTAKVVSYTQSTGVLLVKVYQQSDDGVSTDPDNGLFAAADTTDKEIRVRCMFTRSQGGTL